MTQEKYTRNKRTLQVAWIALTAFRLVPHALLLAISTARSTIVEDVARWNSVLFEGRRLKWQTAFVVLMTLYPEFRNLFYHRIGLRSIFVRFLCPPMSTLYIHTRHIGPGLFIQHGFSTIIAAERIGRGCWINQQVTIGYTNRDGTPVIGDRVVIGAGAKVLGGITIGNDIHIGANAVVVKDLPDGVTAVGVPARIVRRDREPPCAGEASTG